MSNKIFHVQDQPSAFYGRLFECAQKIKSGERLDLSSVSSKYVGNLFFEPSSRTRWSFERACLSLNLKYQTMVVDSTTSASKGEALIDTYRLAESYGFDALVVRSPDEADILNRMLESQSSQIVINAGFGKDSHPTQALLDCFTWMQFRKNSGAAHILIMGDIKHSRVARSHLRLAQILGYKVGLCPTEGFDLEEAEKKDLKPAAVFKNRNEALEWAEVVMCLRAQKERFAASTEYKAKPLRSEELRSDQFLMHPGPFIRGEDIESSLVDDKKSLIYEQVQNGVFCRSALLYLLLKNQL